MLDRLDDTSVGLIHDLEPDTARLIIAFGGHAGRLGIPPFEFFNILAPVQVKTAFVRDHSQAWYHRGVTGIGNGIEPVAEHLRELAGRADEPVMIGASAGGYAALLFGALTGCEAHAFVPQTSIDPEHLRQSGDFRWTAQSEALGDDLDPRYADLRPLLERCQTPCHVYHGSEALDVMHAERLAALPQVTLHSFDLARHNILHPLRDTGWLQRFLLDLARGKPQ
jgi:hypothetical protein